MYVRRNGAGHIYTLMRTRALRVASWREGVILRMLWRDIRVGVCVAASS